MKHILDAIQAAEKVLIGIGEEFSLKEQDLEKMPLYEKYIEQYDKGQPEYEKLWLPLLLEIEGKNTSAAIKRLAAYNRLAELLTNKDYFIVTLNQDSLLSQVQLQSERIVAPCGTYNQLQCDNGCEEMLFGNEELMTKFQSQLNKKEHLNIDRFCPVCGNQLVCNTVKASEYIENGYKEQWSKYMQWLQGTLNHKICIVELGVGMDYPTVIRWAFEKVAYFNQKSQFFRVHSRLFQLTEELAGRGIGIEENAVEFLVNI